MSNSRPPKNSCDKLSPWEKIQIAVGMCVFLVTGATALTFPKAKIEELQREVIALRTNSQ